VTVAMPFVSGALLYVVIDIGSLEHLREIQRHPVKHRSSLGVCVYVFVVVSSNGSGTRHQLSEHENKQHKDEYRDEQLGKGKTATRAAR